MAFSDVEMDGRRDDGREGGLDVLAALRGAVGSVDEDGSLGYTSAGDECDRLRLHLLDAWRSSGLFHVLTRFRAPP